MTAAEQVLRIAKREEQYFRRRARERWEISRMRGNRVDADAAGLARIAEGFAEIASIVEHGFTDVELIDRLYRIGPGDRPELDIEYVRARNRADDICRLLEGRPAATDTERAEYWGRRA